MWLKGIEQAEGLGESKAVEYNIRRFLSDELEFSMYLSCTRRQITTYLEKFCKEKERER